MNSRTTRGMLLAGLILLPATAWAQAVWTVSGAELTAWVGAFMWPFLRIGAVMISAPVFSNVSVPVRVRVLLSVALTVAIMPAAGPAPVVDALSIEAVFIAVQQVAAGLALGLILAVAFQTVVIAGESISLSMGLGFATMVDPQTGVAVPVLSQFMLVMATLIFLAVGGHLMIVQLLAESFTLMPLAGAGIATDEYFRVAAWGAQMYAGAVLIALPAVAVLLTINMIIGVMTRSAPQMNVFSVGFPLMMMVGFIAVLWLVLPSLTARLTEIWREAFDTVRQVLGG